MPDIEVAATGMATVAFVQARGGSRGRAAAPAADVGSAAPGSVAPQLFIDMARLPGRGGGSLQAPCLRGATRGGRAGAPEPARANVASRAPDA